LDLTGAQRARAVSYRPGDVIRYSRGSRAHGLLAGDHAVVQSTEADNNHLRVTTCDGRTAAYDPRRLKGVQVFREEPRVFAQGERIQFRLPTGNWAFPMDSSQRSAHSTRLMGTPRSGSAASEKGS
jgi:hypothetical protein